MGGKKKVSFMCTAFRDGLQSALGARVLTADFLPAVEAAREAGIRHFEAGGGDRFHSLFIYCNEDAFAMMDAFRDAAGPEAELQSLARGIHIVGLDSQPRDIIRLHAKLFAKHGIRTIRNYDPLNDVDNLSYTGRAIIEAGLQHQVCITLMDPPPDCVGAHDADYYATVLGRLLAAEVPYHSVCFKDASGTSAPQKVFETISRARAMLPGDIPIHFHTHETAGMSVSAYRAALEAGAEVIDLSLAPCSGGTCQPDLLVMWHALRGTPFDLDIDVDKVRRAEEVFRDCLEDYPLPGVATRVEPRALWSPLSANVLAATVWMLRDKGLVATLPDLLAAMNEVVRRGGLATSVAPVSEFYAQQATNNVLMGSWKEIAERYGRMVLGYYGQTPVAPDPEIIALASEQLALAPANRPALDINDENPTKGVAAAERRLAAAGLTATEERIFIAATCKQRGIEFLSGQGQLRLSKLTKQREEPGARPRVRGPVRYAIKVNDQLYDLIIDGDVATVNGQDYVVDLEPGAMGSGGRLDEAIARPVSPPPQGIPAVVARASLPRPAKPAPIAGAGDGPTEVVAEMPGKVLRLLVGVGDRIELGQGILLFEAMKMEMAVTAPRAGTIGQIAVRPEQLVATGELLAKIE